MESPQASGPSEAGWLFTKWVQCPSDEKGSLTSVTRHVTAALRWIQAKLSSLNEGPSVELRRSLAKMVLTYGERQVTQRRPEHGTPAIVHCGKPLGRHPPPLNEGRNTELRRPAEADVGQGFTIGRCSTKAAPRSSGDHKLLVDQLGPQRLRSTKAGAWNSGDSGEAS
jgi:hypothetical protein